MSKRTLKHASRCKGTPLKGTGSQVVRQTLHRPPLVAVRHDAHVRGRTHFNAAVDTRCASVCPVSRVSLDPWRDARFRAGGAPLLDSCFGGNPR